MVADDRQSFTVELAREAHTLRFWMIVARNSLPVAGVVVLGWPPLQAAILLLLESWVFVSLRCGIAITVDPHYSRGHGFDAFTFVGNALTAGLFFALVLGMFVWGVLLTAFASAEWSAFFDSGWRSPSFVGAIAAMLSLSIMDAVGHARGFARRTAGEVAADDSRIRLMFYRVLGLLFVSGALGWAAGFGFGGEALVVAIALISIWLEGLPMHAGSIVGKPMHVGRGRPGG